MSKIDKLSVNNALEKLKNDDHTRDIDPHSKKQD